MASLTRPMLVGDRAHYVVHSIDSGEPWPRRVPSQSDIDEIMIAIGSCSLTRHSRNRVWNAPVDRIVAIDASLHTIQNPKVRTQMIRRVVVIDFLEAIDNTDVQEFRGLRRLRTFSSVVFAETRAGNNGKFAYIEPSSISSKHWRMISIGTPPPARASL